MYVEGGNKKDENALIVIHSTRGKEGLDCLFFILHLFIYLFFSPLDSILGTKEIWLILDGAQNPARKICKQ